MYSTTHKGIAAYLLTKGYEIERCYAAKNRDGRDTVKIEINVDRETGREMGDSFYHGGQVHGDLKQFYDKLMEVNQEVWKAKR